MSAPTRSPDRAPHAHPQADRAPGSDRRPDRRSPSHPHGQPGPHGDAAPRTLARSAQLAGRFGAVAAREAVRWGDIAGRKAVQWGRIAAREGARWARIGAHWSAVGARRFANASLAFWGTLTAADDAAAARAAREAPPRPAAAPRPAPARPPQAQSPAPVAPLVTPALDRIPSDAALLLLGLFQREGRLVDFLKEDLEHFSDQEVGAAARVVHQGCRQVLADYVDIAPVREEAEGTRVTLPPGFDPTLARPTGNVLGEPPFTGTLAHRGWRATAVRLPQVASSHDLTVLAAAEVEL